VKRSTLLLASAVCLVTARAIAEPADTPADPATTLASGANLLASGRPAEAIALLEALSDRGVVDAVLSYDRGLAYAERVRAGAEQPGDLGRAAHGFEEARALTHDAALARDATRALAAVRAEIAKRRSRAGETVDLEHGVSLGRSIVELLGENAWAVLAAVCAAALAVGIVVRARARGGRPRVAATTTSVVAAGLLAACALVVYLARDARLHLREGVVITTSRVLDARHVALDAAAPVTEGARVTIVEDGTELSHVRVGRVDGWLPAASVLPLAKR
jgi:hypothetical protein